MADPFKLRFEEAIEFFKQKTPLPSQSWDDFVNQAQDFAFTIAGVTGADLLNDSYNLITSALENGDTYEDFKKGFNAAVERAGWTGLKPWRQSLVYHQSLRSAYQAGRYKQMTDPYLLKTRNYWQYRHNDSRVPRKHHLALDGKIYPADSDFWKTAFPPNGFNCFPVGTKVATPNGWVNIEEVKKGDLVIGGSGDIKPVTFIHNRVYEGELIEVAVEGALCFRTTPNHRILTHRGWISAAGLEAGDVLVNVIKEPLFLNIPVCDVNQLDSLVRHKAVSIPFNRCSSQPETLNAEIQARNENVNPIRKDAVIMDDRKTFSLKVRNHCLLNSSRKRPRVWVGRWVFLYRLISGFSSFCYNTLAKKGRVLFELLGDYASRFASFFCLTKSRVSAKFFLLFSNFRHYFTAKFSPFWSIFPLRLNSLASASNFYPEVMQQFQNSMISHLPSFAQLTSTHHVFDIPQPQGFTDGQPLNKFDSLDSFIAYSNTHYQTSKVSRINRLPYIGNVYNLSVYEDESYCLQAATVHNCRCSVFTLSQRDLEREGLEVSEAPSSTVTVRDKATGENYRVPAVDGKPVAEPGFIGTPGASDSNKKQEIIEQSAARLPDWLRRQVRERLDGQNL